MLGMLMGPSEGLFSSFVKDYRTAIWSLTLQPNNAKFSQSVPTNPLPPSFDLSPIEFWKNDAFIIRSSIRQLLLYDPSPGEISQLHLRSS